VTRFVYFQLCVGSRLINKISALFKVGRGIETRCGGFFKFTPSFQPHYGPGVDSASNRNEYQESSWGKGQPARRSDNLSDNLTAICEPIV
jgi:hypothetical protein